MHDPHQNERRNPFHLRRLVIHLRLYFHTSAYRREERRVRGASAKGEEGHTGSVWDEEVPVRDSKAMLDSTFVVDENASVQSTLYKIPQCVITENANVNSVSYALSNEHYIPVDNGHALFEHR
ncbi:hypothetical protein CPC08DRAFT_716586 [Agrocybe pediades]|nr:hypothetical protein CPC08DRAFT_716586 [Agrocybe pediades]